MVTAYEHLRHQGWVIARQGGGTQVADRPARAVAADHSRGRWTRDLHPEVTDISSFPRLAWRQAFIDAIEDLPTHVLDYRSIRGIPQLREQLSAYLARVHSLVHGLLLAADHPHRDAVAAEPKPIASRVIRAAVDIIEAEPQQSWTLSTLASRSLVSRRSLQNEFRRHMACRRWLICVRSDFVEHIRRCCRPTRRRIQ